MKKILVLSLCLITTTFAGAQLVDTTGMTDWTPMYNSMATWDEGAFNMHEEGHPDYGWGIYNSITYEVVGDSIFVMKLQDGSCRIFGIVRKNSMANEYYIRYADLNNENYVEDTVKTSEYTGKLFVYYSIPNQEIVDREPPAADWDLVLTKYHDNIIDYNVTGLLPNEGVEVSLFKADSAAAASNASLDDTTTFSDSLTIIGNSWYKLEAMSMVPVDTMVYFVRNPDGDIHRLRVNYFESGFSGSGRLGLELKKLFPTEEEAFLDTLTMGSMYVNDVYYSIADSTKHEAPRANWDVAFKTARFTASVLANTTMGVELYTYPHASIGEWYPTAVYSLEEIRLSVYPNPAKDHLNVYSPAWKSGQQVSIALTDVSGKAVFADDFVSSAGVQRIMIPQIPSGMYILKIRSNGSSVNRKIMIAK